jgi:hypothetical protein
MATPRQTLAGLNQIPTAAVIAHEIGHTVVAYLQVGHGEKQTEYYIAFRHRGNGEGAASYNPTDVSSPQDLIVRSLVGITNQAVHCPETIEEGLRKKLIGGSLFASDQCIEAGSDEAMEMARHNAWSDWANMIEETKRVGGDVGSRLVALRRAQKELVDLMRTERFKAIVEDMTADIARWLDEEPAQADFLARYREVRIAQVFSRHPQQVVPQNGQTAT